MELDVSSYALKPGAKAPDFSLQGVDGKLYSLQAFRESKILVVAFTCNHCPYVRAYEDRLIALAGEYARKGVAFVAINSNDDKNYPEDSYENMVERASSRKYLFPYLRDAAQAVARAYRAQCTPEFFAFDASRRLAYHGRLDDSLEPDKVKSRFLKGALDALLSGKPVVVKETAAMGCSIKWKE